jgi:hypothetical protein
MTTPTYDGTTPLDLGAIEAREKAATPGPWVYKDPLVSVEWTVNDNGGWCPDGEKDTFDIISRCENQEGEG